MPKRADARKAREFCEPLLEDLAALADLLEAQGICNDIAPLTAAVAQMGNYATENWSYDVDGLLFPLKQADNPSLPTAIVDLFCKLDLRITGPVPSDPDSALGDPFTRLTVDLIIRAKTMSGRPTAVVWHFDRHIGSVSESPAAHPIYHWQCGGSGARGFAREIGANDLLPILLIDSPRLAHPPLDAVLAVDFVLSNFAPTQWRLMRQLPKYRSIVMRSQKHFWRPYAAGLRRWFANGIPAAADIDSAWASDDLWPHLLN